MQEEKKWINNIEGTINHYRRAYTPHYEEELRTELQYYRDCLAKGKYDEHNLENLTQQEWHPYNDRNGAMSFKGRVAELLAMAWLSQIYKLEGGVRDVTQDKTENCNGIDLRILKWKSNNSVQVKVTHFEPDSQSFYIDLGWFETKAIRILGIDLEYGVGFMMDRDDLKKCTVGASGKDTWVTIGRIRQHSDPRVRDHCIKEDFDLNYLER